MLRGTKTGLEFVFAPGDGAAELAAAAERLSERPEFYRGSRATAVFAGEPPGEDGLGSFLAAVRVYGVEVDGLFGNAAVAGLAERYGLEYLGEPAETVRASERRRAREAKPQVALTDGARSLDADFAGARAEIARRRARGEASVRKPEVDPPTRVVRTVRTASVPSTGTLYHRGTVRGGKALQQLGHIVVVGDVNPGAELVASGDILVFGALNGTAHAGAQGDVEARVIALSLAPTQLRIATFIAAGDERRALEPEVAYVQGDRIAIAPFARQGLRR